MFDNDLAKIDEIREIEMSYYIVCDAQWLGLEDQLAMAEAWSDTPWGDADVNEVKAKIAERDAKIAQIRTVR